MTFSWCEALRNFTGLLTDDMTTRYAEAMPGSGLKIISILWKASKFIMSPDSKNLPPAGVNSVVFFFLGNIGISIMIWLAEWQMVARTVRTLLFILESCESFLPQQNNLVCSKRL